MTSNSFAADAVQTANFIGGTTGGTFTLTFGGQTTAGIAYNASASDVQSALATLSSVGTGNVTVSQAVGGGWEIRFTGTLGGTYQNQITADSSGLTGGTTPSVALGTISLGGDAGWVGESTDPKGLVSRAYTDPLGRAVQTIQNFTDGVVTNSSNKTTAYAYNSAGMTSLTAELTGGTGQTTQWVYGVSPSTGSTITSNDIVGATQWPDPTTGVASSSQQETTTVDALGETLTSTDRNGSVHTLSYDVLGRVVSDAVTTLGAGVDGSVRRIDTAYDSQGNAYLVTSYDAVSGGAIVNQVERTFNGLGQLTVEYQAVGGAVDTATTPKVQYAYSDMDGGSNDSRLMSMTYPSGYVLTYNYSRGLNDSISRLTSISDSTGTLEGYDYLGLGTVVRRSHPQTGVDLTYIAASGIGDAGDQYLGVDRFGRVADQNWVKSGTSLDDFQYGYDRNSNVLYRDNVVNAAFGELYGYEGLNQLSSFARGMLNSGRTAISGTASRTQDWNYDAVGNWNSVTSDGGVPQTRSANKQNEITSISGATPPTYDANGNMTGDETGRKFVYDAWNRLVAVRNSGGTTLETFGYNAMNRRVTQTLSGTTTNLFYSGQGQVLEEKVGPNMSMRYVWSPVFVNAMILRERDTNADGTLDERLWVMQDANYNVTALLNGSGTVVERYGYDPFGVQSVYDASYTVRANSLYTSVYGFQGMRYDATNGLYAASERWYSPNLGRWASLDPLGFTAKDVNLYRAMSGNPINRVDPFGTDDWPWTKTNRPNTAGLPSSDLTPQSMPGGGQPLKVLDYGSFKLNMRPAQWIAGGQDVAGLKGTIEFQPGARSCPACEKIELIQIIRIIDDSTNRWEIDSLTGTKGGFQVGMKNKDTRTDNQEGWFIDINGSNLKPNEVPSIYYKDVHIDGRNRTGSWGQKDQPAGQAAIIADDPHTAVEGKRFEFETVAYCVDNDKYLGSIRWGFVTSKDEASGKVVAKQLPTFSGYLSNDPSAAFSSARAIFETYYQGKK